MTKEEKSEYDKKYRERNKEKKAIQVKEYYLKNKEKINKRHRENYKEYYQNNKEKIIKKCSAYKKLNKDKGRKSRWKSKGLIDSDNDNYDRIYNLWLNQKYCNACDIELTRTDKITNTQACMDHDHKTRLFRHIICHKCNTYDFWKNYFC